MSEAADRPGWPYWSAAALLIAFGTLTGFSIGIPFLSLGVALLALAPFRHIRRIFVPVLVGLIGFFIGFVVVVPLGCTVRASTEVISSGGVTSVTGPGTTCSNLVGIDYSGAREYNPPLWPAAVAGSTVAALAGGLTFLYLRHRGPRENATGATLGWVAVGLNSAWAMFLAGLGLFSDSALDPQWRTALLFVSLAALPAVVATFGLRGRPALILTAGIMCVPFSFMSLAGATLPLLLPGFLYVISYARS